MQACLHMCMHIKADPVTWAACTVSLDVMKTRLESTACSEPDFGTWPQRFLYPLPRPLDGILIFPGHCPVLIMFL